MSYSNAQAGSAMLRLIACACCLLSVACATWSQASADDVRRLASARPRHVRVQLADSVSIEVRQAITIGDSLVGQTRDHTRRPVAFRDMRSLEIRRRDPVYTAYVLGLSYLAGWFLVHYAGTLSWEG